MEIERINELRGKSDAEVLAADWNSSNPGYGLEPISIDEIALYCLEMQYRGKDIPLERFTLKRAVAVEERRMYYLQRVINEIGKGLTDYNDHPYSLYEKSDGHSSDLMIQRIKVSRPHEVACVHDMLQRIKRDADKIKPVLKYLLAEIQLAAQLKLLLLASQLA